MSSTSGQASAPLRYVEWINQHLGFNPRSQQQSNALSRFMLDDLRLTSPSIDADLRAGAIRAVENQHVHTRIAFRNVDFLLMNAAEAGPLGTTRVSIEHKTLMTAHGKARKNRYGDIIAYANHVHNHHAASIAAASLIINTSTTYVNPDAFARDLARPQMRPEQWQHVLESTVKLYSAIPLREAASDPNDQPEAIAMILIDYDGVHPARLVTAPPAPQPDEPTHIVAFYERIARLYASRF